jgi:photosystem II stability/assembly factor-like uncharacterized protein
MADLTRVNELFYADQGAVFVQEEPNSEPKFVGCMDVGDVTQSLGDITRRHCATTQSGGGFDLVSRRQGPDGEVTTSLTGYLGKTFSWLEKLKCKASLFINHVECGNKSTFANWSRAELLTWPFLTSRTKSNAAMRETTDNAELAFDASAAEWVDKLHLTLTRLTTTETLQLNSLASAGYDRCVGPCGGVAEPCDALYATALSAVAPAFGHVVTSTDGGVTWAATAANPFAAGIDIHGVVVLDVDASTKRVIVGYGETQGGAAASVAYSDDAGASWTSVSLDTANAEFVTALAKVGNTVYAGTDQGTINISTDGGLTWAEQATSCANDIRAFSFANENLGLLVGDSNECHYTVNGGSNWVAVTGPAAGDALLSCKMLDRNRWWVGQDDSELWYTVNGGTTWTQRTLPAPASFNTGVGIHAMTWYNDFVGWIAVNYTTAGADRRSAILETINGGYSWEILQISDIFDSGQGVQDMINCGPNKIYGVGDPETTAYIFKAEG